MPMYMIDTYVFETNGLVPRSVQRSTDYRFAAQERLNRSPAQQALGVGADKITFQGVLYPCEQSGQSGKQLLNQLRDKAGEQQAMTLVDGQGHVYGRWVIDKITENRSHLWQNADPRKITFNMSLLAYGEDAQ